MRIIKAVVLLTVAMFATAFAQDAAVAVMVDVIGSGLDAFNREFIGESGDHHLVAITQRLQLAATTFFTGRAEMVARDKQHLDDRFP